MPTFFVGNISFEKSNFRVFSICLQVQPCLTAAATAAVCRQQYCHRRHHHSELQPLLPLPLLAAPTVTIIIHGQLPTPQFHDAADLIFPGQGGGDCRKREDPGEHEHQEEAEAEARE